MRNIKVNTWVVAVVIALTLLAFYGANYGIGKLVDEAWQRGFNTGSESQKAIDDARQAGEKIKAEREKKKGATSNERPSQKSNVI